MTQTVYAPWWNESGEGQDQWDTLILAGNTWPGLATISGSGVKRRIDVKKTKGKDGAVIKDNGMDLASIRIALRIWTAEHWTKFNELLPTIHPKRKGGTRVPTEIVHPQANTLGIKAIYISQIEVPDLDRSSGIMTIDMTAIEWVPRPPPVKKAAGTKGGSASKDQAQVKDNLDPINGALSEQVTQTGVLGDVVNSPSNLIGIDDTIGNIFPP